MFRDLEKSDVQFFESIVENYCSRIINSESNLELLEKLYEVFFLHLSPSPFVGPKATVIDLAEG